ncbi:MAG TPA: hypothetical protein VK590_11105 [Saprospiraceae bacterium]|nr:hypothetical protein [Saprospiraceae bacterium]
MRLIFNRIPSNLFILILLISSVSCDNSKIQLEAYYYPLSDLKEGKIYIYESLQDSVPPSFWYYKSVSNSGKELLESQSFDTRMQINQFAIERRAKSGMLLQSNTLFIPDSTGKRNAIKVDILQKNMYPFSVTDTNGIFLYSVKWTTRANTHNTVTRNRRFLGFEGHNYKGKSVKCAKFELKELIEDYNDGYLEYKINGFEYYGLHLGLVYYEKIVNDKIRLAYELKDILSVNEFERKYNTKFQAITH